MLRKLIKKEILENLSSSKFIITFSLCSFLIILSIITSLSNYKKELDDYNSAVILNRNNLLNQPTYLALAGYGVEINKQPELLSVFVYGLSGNLGKVANINIARDPKLIDSKFNNDPLLAIFGILDIFFVVKIILSLVLILFTYDLIVGEKERGTLKLILSNSVPYDKLILGKAIGSFISFVIPLLIPFLIGIIIILLFPGINLKQEDLIRTMLIFLSFILYLTVILFLSIFISVKSKKSSVCLLSLLFIWVLFIAVLPKLSVLIAHQIKEAPSIYAINSEKEAILHEIQGKAQILSDKWRKENFDLWKSNPAEYMKRYKEYLKIQQQDLTGEIQTRNATIEKDYQEIINEQRNIAIDFSRISPASTLMYCSMKLSRTDISEHEKFVQALHTYKKAFTTWVNIKMIDNMDSQKMNNLDLSDMPEFNYNPTKLNSVLKSVIFDLTILLLFAIIFFIASYFSFLKYDVQ